MGRGLALESARLDLLIRAERRAGEMMVAARKTGELTKDGQRRKAVPDRNRFLTLNDIGITKKESADWTKLARAERRAGEMLRAMEKHPGGGDHTGKASVPVDGDSTGNSELPVPEPIKLADLGISKKQSSDWQRIADLDRETEDETRGAVPRHPRLRADTAPPDREFRRYRTAFPRSRRDAHDVPKRARRQRSRVLPGATVESVPRTGRT